MTQREIFLRHIAQTSASPIGLEISSARGIYQYDTKGKAYIDLISGFSVANIGHSNEMVVAAVQKQAAEYMHLIVYGEFIETPQVSYAKLLCDHLPTTLDCVYFTNSGTEATEGAMKLAKRATGRSRFLCFDKSYHGSTQGALSLMGDEYWRNAFRPLLPEIYHFPYGGEAVLDAIDHTTAAVILETVQAESGVNKPSTGWMEALREKCTRCGALLVLDEIQAGFGRTGSLWAFEQFGIIPDVLLLGKALGGGMPLGAFIASKHLMDTLAHDPVLGHITTFGGHPVSCAAGKAAFEVLLSGNYIEAVKQKEKIITEILDHPLITGITTAGLWASVAFKDFATNKKVLDRCKEKGLISDWFLFAPERLRIAPPLIITTTELRQACLSVRDAIADVAGHPHRPLRE